jgi:hypothetical protein
VSPSGGSRIDGLRPFFLISSPCDAVFHFSSLDGRSALATPPVPSEVSLGNLNISPFPDSQTLDENDGDGGPTFASAEANDNGSDQRDGKQ